MSPSSGLRFVVGLVVCGCCLSAMAVPQPTANDRPVSVGVNIGSHVFIGGGPTDAATGEAEKNSVLAVDGEVRYPLPFFPEIQPQLRFGSVMLDGPDSRVYERTDGTTGTTKNWDHRLWYIGGGAAYIRRFNRFLQAGVDVFFGSGLARYRDVISDGITTANRVYGGGALMTISPIYNVAIELRPSVFVRSSTGDSDHQIDRYDGTYFGIAGAVHLRLGRDPESGGPSIRSIEFEQPKIKPMFAAMQSYYATHPLGSVAITNVDEEVITDVALSFFQPRFMDGPTSTDRLNEIKPGETVTVHFPAIFNDEVFEIEGTTPLTGEIKVSYRSEGSPAEQTTTVSYDLYDKTALTWDDDRKIGAFVTPSDSSLRQFTSEIGRNLSGYGIHAVSEELQFAAQAYHAIAQRGVRYQPDPSSPFTRMQDNTALVDSVSLPRDTAQRLTGDCDDLASLYCTVLETRGIQTGFVTTPGHIYSAFNTKVSAGDYQTIHPDPDMSMVVDGEVWIPVEVTMLGKGGFVDAWTTGMEEYRMYKDRPQNRGFFKTADAHQLYRPIGLRTADQPVHTENTRETIEGFQEDLQRITTVILDWYRKQATDMNTALYWTHYGVMAAEMEQFSVAEEAFRSSADARGGDPVTAEVNIGAMYYLERRYADAVEAFERAELLAEAHRTRRSTEVKLQLNLSKAYYALERWDLAKDAYDAAVAMDAGLARQYSYLGEVSASGVSSGESADRAALAGQRTILFVTIDG